MQACRRVLLLQGTRSSWIIASQSARLSSNAPTSFHHPLSYAEPTRISPSITTSSPRRDFRSTTASLGVMDTMRSAYDTALQGSEEKREGKVFQAQMKYLIAEKRINMDVFLELLQEMKSASGMGGVKEHLPWVRNNPAMGEFKKQEEILRAFTPAERANVFQIGIGGLKRVARAADTDLNAVEGILGQVKSMISIQKWIKKRKAEGLKLPESSRELQDMLLRPGSGMSRKAGRSQKVNPGIRGGTTARRKVM